MRRPDYLVTPTYVLHVATLQRWDKTFPQWNGIAQAVKLAKPGDTIGFIGEHEAIQIGSDNLWDPRAAFWNEGPIHDIKIYGLDQHTSKLRGETNFQNRNNGAPYNIEFANYTHIVTGMRCIITFVNQGPFLGLAFRNIQFDVSAANFLNEIQANDWIFRFHGRAQFIVDSCVQLHQNQMHFVYADNVAGDSYITNCRAIGNGRTMVQVVNRNVQEVSQGNILVERCLSVGAGHLDGGSAFTCSGHLNGTITFRNCHTKDAIAGSLTAWAEGGVHPSHLNAEGKAIDNLIVDNCAFHSTASDRSAIAINSCSLASVGKISVISNQDGLRLNSIQGQDNVKFRFTHPRPSQMRWAVPHKVVTGYNHATTHRLTDEEIDALYEPAQIK